MSAQNTKVATDPASLEAGWRPDPTGRYEWRYWDGGWTNRVASSRPAPSPAAAATTVGSPADPAAPVLAPVHSFSADAPAAPAAPAPADPTAPDGERERAGLFAKVRSWFSSFATEPESYHSDRVVDIDPDPRGERMLVPSPSNYGRAGLVALSACGIAVGSYLPWLSGTIDGIPFRQTGFDGGHGWSFTIGAFALVCAALLAVKIRPLRWIAIGLALLLAGLTFRELVHTHDVMTTMNASATIEANVGTGLWIMCGCAVVALVASFRLGERE